MLSNWQILSGDRNHGKQPRKNHLSHFGSCLVVKSGLLFSRKGSLVFQVCDSVLRENPMKGECIARK